MNPGFIVRLRPAGPWRIGPASGARNVVDHIYHSDSLYSAITSAIAQLDSLDEWLAATACAEGEPAVRFSSLFPYQREMLFVPPPRNAWPPQGAGKVRWQGARFIPAGLVARLMADPHLDEDRWVVDGATGCLLSADRGQPGPFRTAVRTAAAVDRLTGESVPHSTACLEFSADAGLWCAVAFADESARKRWGGLVRGAFRLLADSGFGGERSRGWGRAESPSINEGKLPGLILETKSSEGEERAWWLLSVFSPSESDPVDWNRGNYAVVARGGRVESPAGWGAPKRVSRVVREGSVLVSATAPRGAAVNVAPEGFPHPVYRYGYALSISIPLKGAHRPAIAPVIARVPVEKQEAAEVAPETSQVAPPVAAGEVQPTIPAEPVVPASAEVETAAVEPVPAGLPAVPESGADQSVAAAEPAPAVKPAVPASSREEAAETVESAPAFERVISEAAVEEAVATAAPVFAHEPVMTGAAADERGGKLEPSHAAESDVAQSVGDELVTPVEPVPAAEPGVPESSEVAQTVESAPASKLVISEAAGEEAVDTAASALAPEPVITGAAANERSATLEPAHAVESDVAEAAGNEPVAALEPVPADEPVPPEPVKAGAGTPPDASAGSGGPAHKRDETDIPGGEL